MMHTEARSDTVTVTVNGERRDVPPGATIGSLLATLALDPRLVVIERNREIVRDRDTFSHTALESGDAIEIVHFVGGG